MSRWRGASSVTSRPPIEIVPALTSSSPAIIRSSVDFPQPDGPTSTMNSPSSIVSETSSIAMKPLGELLRDAVERRSRPRAPHPFTAPAVSPNAIFRCTNPKKIRTGIAARIEPGHQPAPVDLRGSSRRTSESQTVIVCFDWSLSRT